MKRKCGKLNFWINFDVYEIVYKMYLHAIYQLNMSETQGPELSILYGSLYSHSELFLRLSRSYRKISISNYVHRCISAKPPTRQ